MKEFRDYDQIIKFCYAISSPTRAEIVRLLTEKESMNIQELAKKLSLTSGALTAHIKMLNEAEIIRVDNVNGQHGVQKRCSLRDKRFLLDIAAHSAMTDAYEIDMPVGSYIFSEVKPTCGIATKSKIIGQVDEPRYFDDPKHFTAEILWLYCGYVEYRVPNFLKRNQKLQEIRITQEICSEAPGIRDDYPSDIHFYINDIDIGYWTSPGDFGGHHGIYTPDWWTYAQYGLLKTLSITQQGSFVDSQKISETTIFDLNLKNSETFLYRIGVPADAKNMGGLTIFGKNFGNYNQNINIVLQYETASAEDNG